MGIRILIVEDDAVLALVAAAALDEAGYDVVGPAYDAAGARALADTGPVDLAVVDINLAGADEGLEVARRLRDEHGVRSLFVSGQLEAARAHPDLALGLLRKPYETDDLVRSVARLHALATGRGPGPEAAPAALEIF